MKVLQKKAFLKGEGDAYYRRNRTTTPLQGLSHGYEIYAKYLTPGSKILEIGCNLGHNLDHFVRTRRCAGYGIEPSRKAVAEGKKRYPSLHLAVGTSDALPFKDGFFDFVLFGFCLYLVDRPLLLRSLAEADRVLKPGGFVGITDFDTKRPVTREYRHRPGVRVYKTEYWKLFEAFPEYTLVEKKSFSHGGDAFAKDVQERVASTVLVKDAEPYAKD